jgi:hypothetical protein
VYPKGKQTLNKIIPVLKNLQSTRVKKIMKRVSIAIVCAVTAAAADPIVMNQQKLLAMGVGNSQAQALLNNRWYSLTVLTALVTELERLPNVAGRPEIIALAATATNEEEAQFFAASLHLLSRLKAGKRPIGRMIGQGTVIGVTPGGEVVVPAPVDYVSWTERIGRFDQRPDLKAAKHSIWLTGEISETAERGFIGLGWHLFQNLSPSSPGGTTTRWDSASQRNRQPASPATTALSRETRQPSDG